MLSFLLLAIITHTIMKGVDNMRSFITTVAMLGIILIATSLLVDKLMAIFIVCIVTCLYVDKFGKDRKHSSPKK
jgi:hypothetical protein